MNAFWLDVQWSCRTLLKTPAASLAIVAILGSAIAMAIVLGSLFAGLIDNLPQVDAPESIVRVWRADDGRPAGHREPTAGDFLVWKHGARTLTALTASVRRQVIVGGADGRAVTALFVTTDYFNLAGRRPRLGHAFDAGDARRGDVAIISDRLWRERFKGEAQVVGRTLAVDVKPREIVGVLPAGFWLPAPGVDVWLPFDASTATEIVDVVGRLKPGVAIEQAQSEFDVLAQRASERAADPRNNRMLLRTFRGESVATMGPRIQGLIAPALALLLIALWHGSPHRRTSMRTLDSCATRTCSMK